VKLVWNQLRNANFNKIFLVSLIMLGIICIPLVASSLTSGVTIPNSLAIATISPLHVDGRFIEDMNNNTITLRGVNVGGFTDAPGGMWSGTDLLSYSEWQNNQALVTAELDAIQSWGCNVVRCHYAAQYWVQNTNNFRTIIYQFVQLCAQRDIYVILDGFCVWGWFSASGGQQATGQDALPYPPYQLYANSSTIIPNQGAYENMMLSIATTLSNCSNVIISMWNEAGGGLNTTQYPTAESDYLGVTQTTINMIRSAGVQNIVLATWSWGLWANLQFPPPQPPNEGGNPAGTLSWVYDYPLNGTNIAYDIHYYDAFGQNVTYAQIVQGLTDCWLPYVLNNLTKPVLIGEIGADIAWTGDQLTAELNTFNYTLEALNGLGVGYCGWFFGVVGIYQLINTYGPSWTPTAPGTILIDNIAINSP